MTCIQSQFILYISFSPFDFFLPDVIGELKVLFSPECVWDTYKSNLLNIEHM